MTQTDGKICHAFGLEESIFSKWLYDPKQSTDSVKSLLNYQWHFSQNWNKHFKIYMETQKTMNSYGSPEKEKWSWRNQAFRPQTILQSYSHQNSMVFAHKRRYRSMEQDKKSRNKPTYLWLINLSFFFFGFLGPHQWHMEVPRLRGLIRAVAASLHNSHSNEGSALHLQPTPQLMAMPDALPTEQGQGSQTVSSWMLVRFVST